MNIRFLAVTDDLSLGLSQIQDLLNITKSYRFTDGSDDNQIDQMLHRTDQILAPAGTQDFDLRGVLNDGLGQLVTLSSVKGLFVNNKSALNTDAVLEIGAASYNAWAELFGDMLDTIKVKPGGIFLWVDPTAAGVSVPAGEDILQVKNAGSADNATFDIVILGVQS